MAEEWIGTHQQNYQEDREVNFAITLRRDGSFIGSISLLIDRPNECGEISYWITTSYWNQGYATECARRVVQYAFEAKGLNRVYAQHFKGNPASGQVLRKIGMTYEGCLRQHLKKWGHYEDLETYGILRSEYHRPESA
jgi:RimJ/RimL family protein N-acetyltransferase